MLVRCSAQILDDTISALRARGALGIECVVLWLGKRSGDAEIRIAETYIPDQIAARDYFEIPAPAMRDLMRHLRGTRQILACQVHSHPFNAFHSTADDEWAIVRHEGALSIVVPRFASEVRASTFSRDAAFFRLDQGDVWRSLSQAELAMTFQVSTL
jgi:hypothetical protein